jgi:hypothetical protein
VQDVAYALGEFRRCVSRSLTNDSPADTQLQEDMRRNQYLITNDVERYMAEYEVSYALFFFRVSTGAQATTGRLAGTPT